MEDTQNFLNKKNIITFLVIGILLLIIPVGVKLVQEQQQLRSKAAPTNVVTFTGPNVSADGKTTTSPEVEIELRSPLGPPAP